MCHRALTVDFDKGINFIYGPNGSGKSAIVAAIQMCFGGKAKNTHRFKKADDLIRRGWSGHAKVEITVINNPDGYQYSKVG
jgi:chromosome segregation ATPase